MYDELEEKGCTMNAFAKNSDKKYFGVFQANLSQNGIDNSFSNPGIKAFIENISSEYCTSAIITCGLHIY